MTDTLERPDKQLYEDLPHPLAEMEERMQQEKKRLNAELEELELRAEAIRFTIGKIDAYFGFDPRKAPAPQPPTSTRRPDLEFPDIGEKPKRTRAPRGSGDTVQERVLAIIHEHGERGIRSGDIEKQLPDVKGIPNALSKLRKLGKIQSSGKGQPIFPMVTDPGERDDTSDEEA